MNHSEVAQEIKDQITKDGFVWVDQIFTDKALSSGPSKSAIKIGLGAVLDDGYVRWYFRGEELDNGTRKALVAIFPPGTTYNEASKILKDTATVSEVRAEQGLITKLLFESKMQRAKELSVSGMSNSEIAEVLGESESTVLTLLK